MKKAIKIQIPEPCHEDWAKMTPTEKGKHCNVCTKEVIDFTNKTDEYLVKYLTKNANTCGRFKKTQLNREVKLERKSRHSLIPYAASLLLPLSIAANTIEKTTNKETSKKEFVSLEIHSLKKVVITGLVVNNKSKLVNNATVTVKETGAQTVTNASGQYKITAKIGHTLVISHTDYHTLEIAIPDGKTPLNTVLESRETVIINAKKPVSVSSVVLGGISTIENKITITGTVTDDASLPLPGVNIVIKGTNKGTQTDFDGNYSIEAETNQTLIFSYVGFETKEVTTANVSNTIDVEMNGWAMGELVVVGYAVSYDDGYIEQFPKPRFRQDPERKAWREALKKQRDNAHAFKQIKKARKKAARQLKRKNKKS